MDLTQTTQRASFIWNIAKSLRGAYRPHDYGKVILPMTVLRRFDCVIAPTREAVWARAEEYKDIANVEELLFFASGQRIYNTSPFDLERLLDDPENTAGHLREYVTGFSPNAVEIMERFDFNAQISKLEEKERLRPILARFIQVDLHPASVPNEVMGHIFEDLIHRFYELANEEAGDYFTPREVIRLLVDLLFADDGEVLTRRGIVKTLYDPAAGTGGMLSVADDYFGELNPYGTLEVFGQDYNDESYAICRADMLVKGKDESHIHAGNSLTRDGVVDMRFDYMLSNPPYGVDWGDFADEIEAEYEATEPEGRFGAGLPPKDDGALLFLQHMISKMKALEDGGSRIGIVLSGSPLFAGNPGSGMGAIRAWLLERDLVEAIVALPEQLFYNTGIATYIWLVTNRKAPDREGLVQLIDGRSFWSKMAKSLGEKRRRLDPIHIAEIVRLHGDIVENEHSKVLPIEAFRFDRVTVEQPLALRWEVDEHAVSALQEQTSFKNLSKPQRGAKDPEAKRAQGEAMQQAVLAGLAPLAGRSTTSQTQFEEWLAQLVTHTGGRVSKAVLDAVRKVCERKDADGSVAVDAKGNIRPDPALRDYENVPHGKEVDEYLQAEVLPWAPDAWIDHTKTVPGYEIPITRLFFRYQPPRPLAEIDADIQQLEEEVLGLLRDVTA